MVSLYAAAAAAAQAKDYRGAIAVYTQGIEACLQQKKEEGEEEKGAGAAGRRDDEKQAFDAVAVAALYGNRAASHVMILGYEQAISDCDSAVALNPKFANAIFRKAMALKKLVRCCCFDIQVSYIASKRLRACLPACIHHHVCSLVRACVVCFAAAGSIFGRNAG